MFLDPPPLHMNCTHTTIEFVELNITCEPSNNNFVTPVQLILYSWLFTPLRATSDSQTTLHSPATNETLKWTSNSICLRPSRSQAGLYYCIASFNVTDDFGEIKILTSFAATRLYVKCALEALSLSNLVHIRISISVLI